MNKNFELYTMNGIWTEEIDEDEIIYCKILEKEGFAEFKNWCKENYIPVTMPSGEDRFEVSCFVLTLGSGGNMRFVPITYTAEYIITKMRNEKLG